MLQTVIRTKNKKMRPCVYGKYFGLCAQTSTNTGSNFFKAANKFGRSDAGRGLFTTKAVDGFAMFAAKPTIAATP